MILKFFDCVDLIADLEAFVRQR
jgi:hypothetical protein